MSNPVARNLRVAKRRKVSFCLTAFTRRLEAAGIPRTIGEEGNFIRRDCLLHEPVNELAFGYLAEHLFKKWEEADPSYDRSEAARQRFVQAEAQCAATNKRFSPVTRHHGGMQAYLDKARLFLEDLLGSVRGRSDQEARNDLLWAVQSYFNFGPGASTRLPRARGDKAFKYSGKPESTAKCAFLAESLIRTSPVWTHAATLGGTESPVCITRGNRVVTVPKNYKTDRTIAIEPDMNMYIQKGLGGYIRSRLKRVGIDLDDQSVNQRLAHDGSLDGSLATIDLSMASDTVARRLCHYLLPSHITDFVEETRCDYGVLPDGTVMYYQKVSSMGNGFTFELESAIFWALTKAVISINGTSDHRFSVYGDDIIAPSAVIPELFELLDYCGFTLNKEKSFWTGYFRESCGKHYYRGIDVTPFYIKKRPRSQLDVVLIHNQLWRWRDRVAILLTQDQWDTLTKCLSEIKSGCSHAYRRLVIPDGYGDGGFIGYADEIRIHRRGANSKHRYFDVRLVPTFSRIAILEEDCDVPGLLAKSLLRLERVPLRKTGGTLADRINDSLNVRDGLKLMPASQVQRVTQTFMEIPISDFMKLGYSDAYYSHHVNTFLRNDYVISSE